MKEVIEKLERILELTNSHGICINGTGKFATEESQLEYVESKIRLNAIQALNAFDNAHIDSEKKPRTKVEYVKVEYSTAWQAAKDHEERVEFLYRQSDLGNAIKGNNWKAIQSPSEAAQYHFDLYRRIETPMTERELFIDIYALAVQDDKSNVEDIAGMLFDSGKFKLVN